MSSKNNAKNRSGEAKGKMYNGKKIKPVMYVDINTKFIVAAYENGDLIMDADGKPISFGAF